MHQVSADFFSTVAQVIPTFALVIFLTDMRGDPQSRRLRKREAGEWRKRPVYYSFDAAVPLFIVAVVSVVEIQCLAAVAHGSGSRFLAVVAVLMVLGMSILFLAIVSARVLTNAPVRVRLWFGFAVVALGIVGMENLILSNWSAIWQ